MNSEVIVEMLASSKLVYLIEDNFGEVLNIAKELFIPGMKFQMYYSAGFIPSAMKPRFSTQEKSKWICLEQKLVVDKVDY